MRASRHGLDRTFQQVSAPGLSFPTKHSWAVYCLVARNGPDAADQAVARRAALRSLGAV
jgi:hypothetical protein